MALEDKYVSGAFDKRLVPVENSQNLGREKMVSVHTFEVSAADDDGSVYRLIRALPRDTIITNISIYNDLITGGTDFDLGIYKGDNGDVVDKDMFADGLNMSIRATRIAPKNGLGAVAIEDITKSVAELNGKTNYDDKEPSSYDLCLTANTAGTAAGTISVIVERI